MERVDSSLFFPDQADPIFILSVLLPRLIPILLLMLLQSEKAGAQVNFQTLWLKPLQATRLPRVREKDWVSEFRLIDP
jgi:hypothetical protein